MRMGDIALRSKTPRMYMKLERNHFDSNVPETVPKPFDLNSIEHTYDSIKRLTAEIEAAQKKTGVYRFAIVNALRRSERTYTTYDDLSQISELDTNE